jgi:hypothetical protein
VYDSVPLPASVVKTSPASAAGPLLLPLLPPLLDEPLPLPLPPLELPPLLLLLPPLPPLDVPHAAIAAAHESAAKKEERIIFGLRKL